MTDRDVQPGSRIRAVLRWGAVFVIRFYQAYLRPLLPGQCRFQPTCSEYAAQAVQIHGLLRGGWMTLRRLLRCRPGGGWGLDPVPPRSGTGDRQTGD